MNKKIKKFISKGLFVSMILSNSSIISLCSVISQDYRYETFEGNDIRIDNVLEESNVDLEIEGNTLVNIFDCNSTDNFRWLDGTLNNSGYIEIIADGGFKNFFVNKDSVHVKPSTTYTYFLEIEENTLVKNSGTYEDCFRMGGTHETNYPSYWSNAISIKGGVVGRYKFTLTTKEDFSDVVTGDRGYVNLSTSGKLKMRYMIVEGNHLKEDLDYFKGMKSVGQNDENGHKIEVLSNNKNLFDYENLKNGGYNINTGEWYNNTDLKCTEYIRVKPGTQYIINSGNRTFEYDKNFNLIQSFAKTPIFTTTKDTYYIKMHGTPSIGEFTPTTQLEEGSVSTNFVPYSLNKKEISLNEPLRGISNEVKDRFIKISNKWFVERNCGELTLDVDKAWKTGGWSGQTDTIGFEFKLENPLLGNGDVYDVKSNYFPSYISDRGFGLDIEQIQTVDNSAYYYLRLRIKRSKLETATVEGFKKWLSDKNIKIVYKLLRPTYEPINNPELTTYLDTTYIYNDSTIPANMKVVVDRVANRAQEAIQTAKTTPTTENLSIARMWINLMLNSILKDEFQEDVNNILQIEDLEIEKKKVSANLDLYVRTKNTLSLSLDTNSVTFDNYSGVEDMELLSAVNLTVNSSLPYSLNAYMEEGFYNSDKTNSLEANSLNIRENTQATYKQFVDIKEKVVLKDNCDEGNEKYHTIDLKLNGNNAHKTDVYKTVIKFEIEQK